MGSRSSLETRNSRAINVLASDCKGPLQSTCLVGHGPQGENELKVTPYVTVESRDMKPIVVSLSYTTHTSSRRKCLANSITLS
jgi:hypothetical protein